MSILKWENLFIEDEILSFMSLSPFRRDIKKKMPVVTLKIYPLCLYKLFSVNQTFSSASVGCRSQPSHLNCAKKPSFSDDQTTKQSAHYSGKAAREVLALKKCWKSWAVCAFQKHIRAPHTYKLKDISKGNKTFTIHALVFAITLVNGRIRLEGSCYTILSMNHFICRKSASL